MNKYYRLDPACYCYRLDLDALLRFKANYTKVSGDHWGYRRYREIHFNFYRNLNKGEL